MLLSATAASDITISQAGLYALLGYGMVFFGLILLMIVVIMIGKCFTIKKKVTVPEEKAVPVQEPAPAVAPGSAGELKLYNVEPKTAAMLMAIVADKLGKPINELRFISIKEVTK